MTRGALALSQLFQQPSQRVIAARLEITAGYLNHLIAGRRTPSLAVAQRIARVLRIPVSHWSVR